ncbi:LOW QUALITY PROTEIN: amphiphysin [Aphomia sociella]
MAESKGALIAKSVQKHAGRAKEKLLQNLGKVDRTLDDIFEEHLQNFNRQHQQALRLQKEFNSYIRCIRAVQTASKSLMEAITEVYESGWSGHDLLYVQAQNMEMLWQDFSHKLGDQVLIPLNTYTNQFPEVKKKVEKRGRKLVDYDSQRHSFQNLQANAAKRRDDVKVTKGREQLEEAKRTYEVLNSELHDELPALYDSRVLFYVNNLQTLFSAEQLFHSESSKVFAELEAITDKLANDCQRGSYTKKTIQNNISPASSPNANSQLAAHNGNSAGNTNTVQSDAPSPALNGDASPRRRPPRPRTRLRARPAPAEAGTPPPAPATLPAAVTPAPAPAPGDATAAAPAPATAPPVPARHSDEEKPTNGDDSSPDRKVEELYDIPVGSPTPVAPEKSSNSEEKRRVDVELPSEKENKDNANEHKSDEVYDIPVGATLAGLPAGALYRVRATYRYTREDSDELSFDVGDVIRVVEYDDPDEQEEGWLMGIKESTNEKGMFPANFTRPI